MSEGDERNKWRFRIITKRGELMAKNISEQGARKVIAEVKHPAIDCTLVELGIVKDIKLKDDKVVVTIAFPVPDIPIREMVINSIKEPITKLGAECQIEETVMTPKERKAFLGKEQKNWKGI